MSEGRINALTDRFGKINHLSEHKHNKKIKILTGYGKKWGIGGFGEAEEIAEFLIKRR